MILPDSLGDLAQVRQWVCYCLRWDPKKNGGAGGYGKPPLLPGTLSGDGWTKHPEQWTDYQTAAAQVGKKSHCVGMKAPAADPAPLPVAGVGLVLSGGFAVADLDHVRNPDTGELTAPARKIIDYLASYAEVSPSGDGVHVLARYDLDKHPGGFHRSVFLNEAGEVTAGAAGAPNYEIYAPAAGETYCTITGRPLSGHDRPISPGSGERLFKLYRAFLDSEGKREQAPAAVQPPSVGSYRTAGGDHDREIAARALQAINPALLNGFQEWAPIISAGKLCGLTPDELETWSAAAGGNPLHVPGTIARRWRYWRLSDPSGAVGVIIAAAQRQGFNLASAFTAAERAEYGRALHPDAARRQAWARSKYTEEARREYGRAIREREDANYWRQQFD